MPKYVINKEVTTDVHHFLQRQMFQHCDDFEELPTEIEAAEEHCKNCEYYLACQISNELTFLIASNKI